MKVPVPVYSKKIQHGNHQVGATMENRCKDEINRTNKVSYTTCIQIAFIINRIQSYLDQRKEGRELPRSLHVDAHGVTRIELTKCRQARPAPRTLLPRRRPTAVARGWAQDFKY
jgi:hypothetical protein